MSPHERQTPTATNQGAPERASQVDKDTLSLRPIDLLDFIRSATKRATWTLFQVKFDAEQEVLFVLFVLLLHHVLVAHLAPCRVTSTLRSIRECGHRSGCR